MKWWDVVWAAATGTAIAGLTMSVLAKILELIIKGMDKK